MSQCWWIVLLLFFLPLATLDSPNLYSPTERRILVLETTSTECILIDVATLGEIQTSISKSLNVDVSRILAEHQEHDGNDCLINHVLSISLFGEESRFYFGPSASDLLETVKQQIFDGSLNLGIESTSSMRLISYDDILSDSSLEGTSSGSSSGKLWFEVILIFVIASVITAICFKFVSKDRVLSAESIPEILKWSPDDNSWLINSEIKHKRVQSMEEKYGEEEGNDLEFEMEEKSEIGSNGGLVDERKSPPPHSPHVSYVNKEVLSPRAARSTFGEEEDDDERDYSSSNPHETTIETVFGKSTKSRWFYFGILLVALTVIAIMFIPMYLYAEDVDLASDSQLRQSCINLGYPMDSQIDKCEADILWAYKINSRSLMVNLCSALFGFAVIILCVWCWFVDVNRNKYYLPIFGIYFFSSGFNCLMNVVNLSIVSGAYSSTATVGMFILSLTGCAISIFMLEIARNDQFKNIFWRYISFGVCCIITSRILIEFYPISEEIRSMLEKGTLVGNLLFISFLSFPYLFVEAKRPQIFNHMVLVALLMTSGSIDTVSKASQHRRDEIYVLISTVFLFFMIIRTYLVGFRDIRRISEAMNAIFHVDEETGREVYQKLKCAVPEGILTDLQSSKYEEDEIVEDSIPLDLQGASHRLSTELTLYDTLRKRSFATIVIFCFAFFLLIYVVVRIYESPQRLDPFCYSHYCFLSSEVCSSQMIKVCSEQIANGIQPLLDEAMFEWTTSILSFFVFIFSLIHYRANKHSVSFIGLSFLTVSVLDVYHALAVLDLTGEKSDGTEVCNFSWAVSRLIFSLSLLLQVSLLLSSKSIFIPKDIHSKGLKFLGRLGALWVLSMFFMILLINSGNPVPSTIFNSSSSSASRRPVDFFVFFVLLIFVVLIFKYRFHSPNEQQHYAGGKYHFFLDGMTFSSIPLLWSQGYIAFGSTRGTHDHWFNVGLFFKLLSVLLVLLGCFVDIVMALKDKTKVEKNLGEAVYTNAALAAYIYKRKEKPTTQAESPTRRWKTARRKEKMAKQKNNFFEPTPAAANIHV